VADQETVPGVAALPVDPGLCGDCRHALVKETNRGTVYLRCGRAAWDDRLVRYPRLPVANCPGFEPQDQ
jgi:propionyl-CoA synthetase